MTHSLVVSRHPPKAYVPNVQDDALFAQMAGVSQERVFRLALRITRNHEDAEDAQQDSFLKAYMHMAQFEGRSRFTTWISRIAINEALMCLRRRRDAFRVSLDDALPNSENTTVLDHFQSPAEDPETAYSRRETKNLLESTIARLTSRQRVVFVLRVMEQLSTEETARILGISARAVKTRLRRARCELKKQLGATSQTAAGSNTLAVHSFLPVNKQFAPTQWMA